MVYSKSQRQRALSELIRAHTDSTQEELAKRLSSGGFTVTQATVSRDLDQIGAVKVRRAGRLTYTLPDERHDPGAPPIERVIREWVRSIDTAGNLVIIKTPPGSAHLVGVALDQSRIPEIIGTICGDDATFVACRNSSEAEMLAEKLQSLLADPR